MFGPLDQNLEPRNSSWIQTTNILYVDSPVGVGFSLVDNSSFIPKTTEEISTDLITMLQTFMNEHYYFKNNSFYIFGQSYGGKMAAALTYYLHKAIEVGEIQCNLKGVAIGNGFVSPTDIIVEYPEIMNQMGLIDDVQYKSIKGTAWKVYQGGESGNWAGFYKGYMGVKTVMRLSANGFNIYKITDLTKPSDEWNLVYDMDIDDFMNGPVRKKLGVVPKNHKYQMKRYEVFTAQEESFDFGKPAWHLVDAVLKESDIDIFVYSGQLDIICSTAGALRWISKLTWDGMKDFDKAERKLLNSGHVPADVPDVALRMLNRILDDTDRTHCLI